MGPVQQLEPLRHISSHARTTVDTYMIFPTMRLWRFGLRGDEKLAMKLIQFTELRTL